MANKMVDPKTYARNVMKSAGYITTSTIKGINPDLTSYITDTTSYAKDMYNAVKDYKTTIKNKVNDILGETGFEDLRKVKNNIMDDLRTGKFYNPEREEEANNNLMKMMGISFDFDDTDFDVDEDEGEKVADETATASSINTLASKLAGNQTATSAVSATKIIKGGRANTAATIAHTEKMVGVLNTSLSSIHASILDLHRDLAAPLNTHIINSANFYSIATTELAKQSATLDNIYKMMSDRFAPTGKNAAGRSTSSSNSPWKAVMGNGLPNISAWGKHAKNKLLSDTGLDMLDGFLDPETFQMLIQSGMASPVALLMSSFASNRIANSSFGKGLNRTVNTLKGGFTNMALNISKYAKEHKSDFTLPALLANLFDITPTGKGKMDFGNYNKGRQDWTGEDSKALKVVIPTYLSKILSAMTGEAPKVFDYKTGRFVSSREVKAEFNKSRNTAIGAASTDIKNEVLNEFIEQDKRANSGRNVPELNYSSKAVRNLSKTYDTLVSMLSIKNVDISNFKNANELISFCRRQRWIGNDNTSTGRDYIMDEKSLRRLARILFSNSIAGVQGRFKGAVISGQMVNADIINNAGDTTYGSLYNGSDLDEETPVRSASTVANILNSKDKYGNSVSFYLHSYYEQLNMLLERSIGFGGTDNRSDTRTASRQRTIFSAPSSVNSRRFRRSRRENSTYSAIRDDMTGGDEDAISDDERYRYNSETEEYEEARSSISPSSVNSRRQEEKESFVTKFFNRTNAFLDDLFYGNTDTGIRAKIKAHGGMLGLIRDIPSSIAEMSKNLSDKLKESLTNAWTKFKESDFGKNYFREMKNSIVNFGKDTWQDAKEKAGAAVSFMTGKVPSWAATMSGSRKGGVVQKSGMVSVSEGEIIIPADQNPNYTGHMSNATRDSVERTNYKNWLRDGGNEDEFFGFFREGSKAWTKLSKKDKQRIQKEYNKGKTAEEIADIVRRPVAQIKDYIKYLDGAGRVGMAANEVKQKANEVKNKVKDSNGAQYVERLIKEAGNKIDEGIAHLFGNQETYNNAKKYGAEVTKVAKENLPKTFSSATIGGLVGAALTGSGIGLLGGMVVGAGASIINRSDMLSNALFGSEDVEGNYSGGLLPNSVSKFIKKRLPKVAKSAAIGGVLGTLGFAPGGIFGGLAIGAGLELVSTTDTFKDIMFGKPNVHGQRNGGLMGSLRENVVKPLADFTKGGINKVSDYIKKNFLEPLASTVDPLKDWIKGLGKKMTSGIVDATKAVIKRTIGERLNAVFKPLANLAGKAGKAALGAVGAVASAPFKLVGMAGQNLAAHNINAGYSSKSAKERMELEGQKMGIGGKLFGTKVKNSEYTKWAANATDEDIQAAAHYVDGANSFNRSIIRKRQDMADMLTASLNNGGVTDPKTVKQLKKLFNSDKVRKNNDYSDIINAVNGLSDDQMGSATKKAVLKRIGEYSGSIQGDIDKLGTFDSDQEAFFNRIGLTDEKARKKFIKGARFQSKIDAENIRKAGGVSEAEALAKAKSKDDAAKLLKEQEKENPIDAHRNRVLDSIYDLLVGIAKKTGVNSSDLPKGSKESGGLANKLGIDTPDDSLNSANSDDYGEAPEGTIRTEFVDGNPVQFIYRNGQWNHNMSDSETKETITNQDEDRKTRNAFYNSWVGGGLLDKFKGLFGAQEGGEKKESFFDKIAGFFGNIFGEDGVFGESGILGKIFGALGGSGGIGSVLKTILPTAIGAAATGIVLNKIGSKAAGTSTDSGMNAETDAEERKAEVESWKGPLGFIKKTGLGLDSLENTARGRDTTTYSKNDYVSSYLSDRYTGRMAKNALMSFDPRLAKASSTVISNTVGKIPVLGKALGGGLSLSSRASELATKFGNGVKTVASGVSDAASTFANSKVGSFVLDKAGAVANKAQGVATKVFAKVSDSKIAKSAVGQTAVKAVEKVKSAVSFVFNALVSKLGLKAAEGSMDNIIGELAEAIVKKAKNAAAFLAKAAIVLQIAFVANAVIEGFQSAKAKTILGILDTPTTMQRILAAALNGLNEAIPGIGGLIPTEFLFSLVYTALEVLGCKFGKLSEQRKEAKATVEKYNKENGTTYNIEEYIHNVLGEYTFQEKIANTAKKGWNWLKDTVSKGAKSIGDKFKAFFSGRKDEDEESASGSGRDANSPKAISMGKVNSNSTRLNTRSASSATSTDSNSQASGSGGNSRTSSYLYSGSGTHTTQKGNYRVFGSSTIDQNGCGPASASTVLKTYGKDVSVDDAATYAESGGYVAGSSGNESKGTKASYFGDILARNGIKSSYTDNKDQIKSAVERGKPTVLLGQDKSNSSKTNSPFGPNPHYVVAQGTDRKGNVIVDDPELKGTALYKKDILNKTKLGVVTGGESGVTGVSGLLSTAFSGLTNKVSDKLGDSSAGKIWNFIFGIDKSTEDDASSEEGDTESSGEEISYPSNPASTEGAAEFAQANGMYPTFDGSQQPGQVTYGKNELFTIATNPPNSYDPNIKCFNNSANGGVSTCIKGSPTDGVCNVLANCVGWAAGRFNQIYNILMNTPNQMKYPFNCNAGKFVDAAKQFGLSVGTEPQIGAIMCWKKSGAGHVAIVERVDAADKVYTSESGYSYKKFWNQNRVKGSGNWGEAGTFLGFIYNPAVTAKLGSSGNALWNTPKGKIWRYLKSKGLNANAISGAMGCWQEESRNTADRIEGDYASSIFPGKQAVLASKKSISDYTTGKLFKYYRDQKMKINEAAYQGKDGYYYPGLGLAQWTGPRAQELMDYADQNGKDFRELGTQLDFFWKEFSAKKGLPNLMNGSPDPKSAATNFLDNFEMYNGWSKTTTGSKQNATRQKHAQEIYDTFGNLTEPTEGVEGVDGATTVTTGTTSTGKKSTKTPKRNMNTTKNNTVASGSGTIPVTYDFTNPNHQFGTGSVVDTARRKAHSMIGAASSPEQLNQIVEYIKIIAENTGNNKLLGKLVELQSSMVDILSAISGSGKIKETNQAASQDFSNNIENDITKMQAKLTAIAQTL